jgi:pantetheine-phosphate adenylyltransferase
MTSALFSGSFDPVTYGHLDVVRRAARLFDRVVVAIGVHHAKKTTFSAEERVAMLRELVADIAEECGAVIEVITFDGLAVEAARRAGASVFVRGVRNSADFDYETQMAGINTILDPGVDTIVFTAHDGVGHIASSLVKQIAELGGDLSALVPPQVAERLRARYGQG